MNIHDLAYKKIAIWGAGQEGQAVLSLLQRSIPQVDVTLLDDAAVPDLVRRNLQTIRPDIPLIMGDSIKQCLNYFDVIIGFWKCRVIRPVILRAQFRLLRSSIYIRSIWIGISQ